MFSIAYPSHAERQVYAQRAQRLRARRRCQPGA